MKHPLVSVVIPTYNQGQYLVSAVDSVLFQDYPLIEVLICNHGSTDNTSDIIKNIIHCYENDKVSCLDHMKDSDDGSVKLIRSEARRYPKGRIIKVFESNENIGGTASYNIGFRNATGVYATYLVGDDRLAPGFMKRLVFELEESGADYVYADMAVVDDSDRILQVLRKPDYSFKKCLADWYHLGVAKLYRLNLHIDAGYYDESLRNANDYDMALRFALAGAKFKHVSEILYFLRNHCKDGLNEPANWRNGGYRNLIRESILCARRARQELEKG
jgi:glycosyltransferase involved in cell wall biosynthesis